jgi:hypothetical protein
MLEFLEEKVSLTGLRRPCESPRFDWNLNLQMLLEEVCKMIDELER